MGFAMRINYVDVVVDDSLKNLYLGSKKIGYQFDIRLSYYRGHFLSVIDELGVTVDGHEVPSEAIRFCVNGKEFGINQLESCYTEWWNIIEPATIKVHQPGGLEPGEHDIDFRMIFRSPYMPIGPNHQYMPIDGCGRKTLSINE